MLPLYCVTDNSFLCNLIKDGFMRGSLQENNDGMRHKSRMCVIHSTLKMKEPVNKGCS